MANRLYNKQVTPKGYQEGGKVGKIRSLIGKVRKKIAPTFGEQFSKAKKEGKKTFTSTRDKSAPMKKERLFEGDRGRRKKIIKKLKGAVVKATPLGLGIKAKEVAKKIKERMGKKMGGSLKPVDPKTQKGLSKLPTEVRNKMGYMKKGGKVNGK